MTSFADLSIMTKGKEANYLNSQIKPVLDEQRKRIIEQLKASYRKGDATDISIRVGIGTLVAIDDLQNILIRDVRAAERVQTKIEKEEKIDNDDTSL